jgi:hypothetical protein
MSTDHPAPTADDRRPPCAGADTGRRILAPCLGLALALFGGAIAWAVIEGTSPVFRVPREYHIRNLGAPTEKFDALRAVEVNVNRHNAMLELTWLGALVAGTLALREAIGRRALWPVLLAVPVAAAVGCAAGFAGSLTYEALGVGPLAELTATLKVQAVVLGLLGLGIGLALGLSSGSLGGFVVAGIAGMAGGILASVLYPVAVSFLLPGASTDSLVPAGAANRLLWIAIAAGLAGLTVTASARRR